MSRAHSGSSSVELDEIFEVDPWAGAVGLVAVVPSSNEVLPPQVGPRGLHAMVYQGASRPNTVWYY